MAEEIKMYRCYACGHIESKNFDVCSACGHDFKTGKSVYTKSYTTTTVCDHDYKLIGHTGINGQNELKQCTKCMKLKEVAGGTSLLFG